MMHRRDASLAGHGVNVSLGNGECWPCWAEIVRGVDHRLLYRFLI